MQRLKRPSSLISVFLAMTLLLSPVTAYASVQPFLPSAPGDSGGGGGAVPLWPWGWGIVTSQATSTAFTLTDSYEVLTSKVTYIETSTPAGGPQSFVAFVNQNPTPATNKSYLYMDKDGVRQNIESNITFPPTRNTYTDPDNSNWPFPTYTSSDGTTFTAGTGTWVLPVLNVTLEPGALYEFGFLAGLQSNNGMTGVVYTDAGGQKLGYIQNDNNPSYSDETTQFDTKKLDPYLFRNPYAEPTSTGTFEDFVFRVQTYADLAAFNNALAGAQSAFASASANAGLGVGQIRPDLVTALGSAITSATLVPASGMRMWLQPDVDDLTKTLNDAVAALVPNGLDVDKTAPVSSSDATATYESAPATITITATDEEGGSGVAALYYRLDDNATQTVSAAGTTVVHTLAAEVVASTDGTHTIEFWSTDNAENVESPHNVVTFHIGLFPDTTPPISICDADVSYIGAATITITATDTGPANQVVSGVDSITYTLNGGDPETVSGDTAVVTVAEDGDWILEFWATDNAENEEAPHNVVHFDVTIIDDPDEPDPEDMPITATVKDKHGKGAHGADGYSASDTVSCGMCHESRYPVGATSCTDEGCHRVAEARDLEPDEVNEDPPANHGYIRPNTYDCDGCHSVLSPTGSIERISGADRFATAIAVSKKNFNRADAVILATGMNYADALSASALAGVLEAPLLLTRTETLSPGVLAEIKRLGAEEVWIMGSSAAVSEAVEDALLDDGLDVIRVEGEDRYETSAEVAYAVAELTGTGFAGKAFMARGDNFADGLAVSPLAYRNKIPVILTRPTTLSWPAADAIEWLEIDDVTILGSTAAVSAGVEAAVKALDTKPTVRRLAGATRYETAEAIARHALDNSLATKGFIGVATGSNFPDALAGGAAAGARGGILVLTAPGALSANWEAYLPGAYAGARPDIQLYGGANVLSDAVMNTLKTMLVD